MARAKDLDRAERRRGRLCGEAVIPSTKVEDEGLGRVADQVKEQARQTGHDAIEHGKQIAQDTAHTAAQKAQEVASGIKGTAQDSVQPSS